MGRTPLGVTIIMIIADVLGKHGGIVETIPAAATLREAAQKLVDRSIGGLVVRGNGVGEGCWERLLGIISEREIVRAQTRGSLDKLRVKDAAVIDVPSVLPTDSAQHAMELMTEYRTPHLPVMLDRELQGVISIVDLVRAQMDELMWGPHDSAVSAP